MMFGLALAVAAALSVPTMVAAAGGPPQDRGMGMGQNIAVIGELDAEEQAILAEFLIDEHKALATYEAIMADFGEVAPFSMVARAERQHIAALERVFTRYSVDLPLIPAFDIPSFGSIEEAAAAAAQAEIDNASLYDRLVGGIDNADVVRVATNLRDASLNQHLPAFQSAADGTYAAGEGLGAQNMAGASGTRMMGGRGRGIGGAAQGLGQGTQLRTADRPCPAYQSGTFRGR
jgi:hypothetical protein